MTVAPCHAAAAGPNKLPATVLNILQKNKIPPSSLGILIQELDAAAPLLAHNIDTPLNPASVMKTVTTYAALQILGPEYRWKTEFYIDGKLTGGKLAGNLIVKGYGDPYLTEETMLPMARELRQHGLQHISGSLIVDNSYFQTELPHPGAFDNKPYRVYNANPSALMANYQATRFTLTPNTYARAIEISAWPADAGLVINNRMRFVNGRCRGYHRWPKTWFTPRNNRLIAHFEGNYSPACGAHHIYRSVTPPAALFHGVFFPTWHYVGGTLKQGYRSGNTPANAALFYVHYSKPLADIIRLMNKHSNNVMTKQLLLTVGAHTLGAPGTLQKGRRAITQWMQEEGIDHTGFIIDNGSGLSRSARVTVNTLNQLAHHQWRSPWMPEMLSSLSILGRDGTGKKRFNGSELTGNMHLKTGVLDHVRSMAGFFHSANGKRYVVISLQNHKNIHKTIGTEIQNALLQWLDANS